ncbi:ABC transporter permease [bacterium]|nr:ABC transporter permease [bacterium]
MLQSYIRVAFRYLIKHRVYSLINILGLAAGIASCVLIFLFSKHELTYDAFHKDAGRIFLVQKHRTTALGLKVLSDTWIPLLPALAQDFSGVENGVRFWSSKRWIQLNEKKFEEEVTYTDPEFLKVFDFPLQSGAAESLNDPSSLVITQSVAKQYFGTEDPIGKTLTINFDKNFVVRGVLVDIPQNSSVTIKFLAPLSSFLDLTDPKVQNYWDGSFLTTFIKLKEGISPAAFEEQMVSLVKKQFGDDGPNGTKQLQLKLLPLLEYRDSEFNTRIYAYALLCIAFGIIVIASINYMNLATARTMERVREIGMRKVLGAERTQLIRQFLGESIATSLIAMLLGIGLAELLLPAVNDLYHIKLSLNILEPSLLGVVIGAALLSGVLSGIYPALILSGFKILDSLKGQKIKTSTGHSLRQILVTLQFVITTVLIIGSLTVWDQIAFMKGHRLNFDQNNVIVIPLSLRDFSNPDASKSSVEAFKNDLLQQTGVVSLASSMSVPGRVNDANTFVRPEDWKSDDPLRMRWTAIDENFFETYRMELVEGRNFSFASDKDESVIINETALSAMGWKTAVNKKIKIGSKFYTVIGVVKDYHTESLQRAISPVVHYYRTSESAAPRFVSVRLKPESINSTIEWITQRWQKLDSSREFNYFFVDENFNQLYQNEERIGKVVGIFSSLAIGIACLGLFGLISFTVTQKTKEIGIRKILGASVPSLVYMLSSKLIVGTLIASLLAWPLAYFALQRWLQDFAFRIELNAGVFILATFAGACIAFITVALQAVRAANANPVDALRYE